ncbi:PREDICTED: uncharacterized protein LOC109329279 [Lupinus angustifolius]|uniref:uncharacterized protein LOC109329279 n=1 Tax=Lupinus angustifolius TaxID=3871 RepID=UPI00092FCAE1|nr:PREDICTED: uncharacterized protein LOC109329279 [Lupinus angustifolius]
MLCLYVDDLVITWRCEDEIFKLKGKLKSEFDMTDLGELTYFLGIEFLKTDKGIIMHQRRYITEVLERFKMQNCNHVLTPVEGSTKSDHSLTKKPVDATLFRQMVGCIGFVCHNRSDIAYGAGVISKHMANSNQTHMTAAKRVMRYLKGTLHYGILFPNEVENKLQLVGFSDSNWCGDKEYKRCTSGYTFFVHGAPISWSSKKQEVVALSTCEVEYIAACNATCQGLWLTSLMAELKCGEDMKIELRVDNKSAINLAKNPVSHGRIKHIETKFHFLRDQVGKKKVKLSSFCFSSLHFHSFNRSIKLNQCRILSTLLLQVA